MTDMCPICLGIEGVESDDTLLKKTDLVYEDELVCAFINSFWVGRNKGHVIVVPRQHFENLYTLPAEVGHRVFEVSRRVAIAMKKAYGCDGITLRQNNEPAGDQHAFHYHLHIFPRYENDNFNLKAAEGKQLADPEERLIFAQRIKETLASL